MDKFLSGSSQLKFGEGRGMEEDQLARQIQSVCDHAKERHYTQTQFDMLNGFEFTITRCINCHKTLVFEAKKFGSKS
jgi:hypothetical protein